jgi:hypothetical protein
MKPALLWIVLPLAGCAAGTVPEIDDSTVIDAGTHLAEMAQTHKQLTEVLKTVTDENSARAAIPKLDQISKSSLAGARYARAIQLGLPGPNYAAQEKEWLAALEQFKAELSRIEASSPSAYRVLIPFFMDESKD